MYLFVLIISIIAAVAIFSAQNSQPVTMSILAWHFQASLAIIVFFFLASGIIIGITASFLAKLLRERREWARNHPEIEIKNGWAP